MSNLSALQEHLEATVLYGLLMEASKRQAIYPLLTADCFTNEWYRQMFEAMGKAIDEAKEPNPISLMANMNVPAEKQEALLESILNNIFEDRGYDATGLTVSAASELYENMLRRRFEESAREWAMRAANDNTDPLALMREASDTFQGAINPVKALELPTVESDIRDAFNAALHAQDHKTMTGIKGWDDTIDGLHNGALYTILGHGGVSKTALALNISWRVAKQNKPVVYLSYEESKNALLWRVFAAQTGIPVTAFRNGLSEQQQAEFTAKQQQILDVPLHVNDNVQTMEDGIQAASAFNLQNKLGLVVVDVVSNIEANPRETEVEKAKRVGLQCLRMAKDLDVPVMLLAHVNSEAIKGKASMTSAYGGQGLMMPSSAVVELRRDTEAVTVRGRVRVNAHVVKNRYGVVGTSMPFDFEGLRMRYHDAS